MKSSEIHDTQKRVTWEAVMDKKTRRVDAGTVLCVTRSGILARAFPVAVAARQVAFNQDIRALVPHREKVDPVFLMSTLRWLEPSILANGIKKGATVHSVRSGFLESLKIPYPSLHEQRQLAAQMAEQMSRLDEARLSLDRQIKAVTLLRAAFLREAFENEGARDWPVMRLEDAGQIGAGLTLGRVVRQQPTRSVPYLRVANVKDGYLLLDDVSRIEVMEVEISRYLLREGDVLFTEGGDPDKLGRGTVWRGELPECLHQNHIFRVRFDQTRYSPDFVALQAASPYGKRYFLGNAKQTTGIASINQKVLAGFPLMAPEIETQRRVVAMLSEQMLEIQRLRNVLENQKRDVDSMFSALLNEAFASAARD